MPVPFFSSEQSFSSSEQKRLFLQFLEACGTKNLPRALELIEKHPELDAFHRRPPEDTAGFFTPLQAAAYYLPEGKGT